MYDGSKVCVYTWEEQSITGYTSSSTKTDATTTVITNTHVTETTKATVKKVWDDKNNLANARPSSLFVTLVQTNDKVELNEANNWTATIDNLPKYSNGTEIAYTWTEDLQTAGYTKTGEAVSSDGITTTITNTYDLTQVKTSVTVKKVWADSDNAAGKRPASLVMTLSNGQSVTLTAIAVTGLPEGYTCAATYSESSVTLNSTDKDGSIAITNTYTYTAPETVEATVKKVWDDNDNQDGIRPVSLTVDLLKNGTKIDEVTLNAGNNWSATKSGLKKYDNGVLNVYTWSEPTITGYTSATMTQDTVTTFTNTHAPEEISVSVKKNWNDYDNVANKRPSSLEVTLSNGTTVTLNASNNWSAKVDHLPKFADGNEIVYTWSEGTMPIGYGDFRV